MVNPFGNARVQSSSALTKRVKCAGVEAWSTLSSGIAAVWVVGVSVCRGYDEATALRIGWAYQQATDWHERRPPGIA